MVVSKEVLRERARIRKKARDRADQYRSMAYRAYDECNERVFLQAAIALSSFAATLGKGK